MTMVGTFFFGVVIGWLVYFSVRYRTSEVSFKDLGTLIGVVAGGAVTRLFVGGDDTLAGELFGVYGLGLATGFFLYFLALVVFVAVSKDLSWSVFLTGVPKGQKDHVKVMSAKGFGFHGSAMETTPARASIMAELPTIGTTNDAMTANRTISSIDDELDSSIEAVGKAITLIRRSMWNKDVGASELSALSNALEKLTDQVVDLQRLKVGRILLSEEIQSAAATLKKEAEDLDKIAKRFETLTEQFTAAKKAVDKVLELAKKVTSLVA